MIAFLERNAALFKKAILQGEIQRLLTVMIYNLTFLCDKQEFLYGFSLNYPLIYYIRSRMI